MLQRNLPGRSRKIPEAHGEWGRPMNLDIIEIFDEQFICCILLTPVALSIQGGKVTT